MKVNLPDFWNRCPFHLPPEKHQAYWWFLGWSWAEAKRPLPHPDSETVGGTYKMFKCGYDDFTIGFRPSDPKTFI